MSLMVTSFVYISSTCNGYMHLHVYSADFHVIVGTDLLCWSGGYKQQQQVIIVRCYRDPNIQRSQRRVDVTSQLIV